MAAYEAAPKEALTVNTERVKSVLARHKYGLSNDELARIENIYETFNRGGPFFGLPQRPQFHCSRFLGFKREYDLPGPALKRFQANVATLPIDASSIFIRWAMRTPYSRWNTDPNHLVMTLTPMSELVDLLKAGRAPGSFAETIGATKELQTVVDSMCKILRCIGSLAASPK